MRAAPVLRSLSDPGRLMGDEGYDEEYDDEGQIFTGHEPQKWHWSYLALRGAELGANICVALKVSFTNLANDIAAHSNYEISRDEFAAEAGRELEMILENTDGERTWGQAGSE